MNRYAHVAGDPIKRLDSQGLYYQWADDNSPQQILWGGDLGGGGGCDSVLDSIDGFVDTSVDPCSTYSGPVFFQPPQQSGGGGGGGATAPMSCTVSLDYRPVGQSGSLSLVNHAYIDVTMGATDDVIEGLPQYNPPQLPPTLWGNLTSNVFTVTNGVVAGDPSDHPLTDPSTGGVGGTSVCQRVQGLLNEAANFPTTKYNPVPGLLFSGSNSNTYASTLLQGVGLNSGTPPFAPGFDGPLNPRPLPILFTRVPRIGLR